MKLALPTPPQVINVLALVFAAGAAFAITLGVLMLDTSGQANGSCAPQVEAER